MDLLQIKDRHFVVTGEGSSYEEAVQSAHNYVEEYLFKEKPARPGAEYKYKWEITNVRGEYQKTFYNAFAFAGVSRNAKEIIHVKMNIELIQASDTYPGSNF